MAKFKIGDRVKQTNGPGKGATGKIVNIYPLRPDMVASMGFGEYVGHDLITFMGPEGKSIVPEDWLVAANSRACNSRNPIVAKAMNACGTAKNAVTITLDSRKRDGWVTGKVNGYDFEAKVFDEGSDFGIKSGRVSKLWMRKGDETVNYDRGWDERPKSAEAKAAYTELLRKMESLPKVMNACGTARNADGDIKPVEKEYTAAIRAVRELAVKAKSIDPRSRMYQDAVKAGTALYGGMKPNW